MSGPKESPLLRLPHPVSRSHAPMSRLGRAAQFAPFAALTGYDALVEETARYTEAEVELDADEISRLDETLQELAARLPERPAVRLTYFEPDLRKSGGARREKLGKLKSIDPLEQQLLFTDGSRISLSALLELEAVEEA